MAPVAAKGKGAAKKIAASTFEAERGERKDRRRQLFRQGQHIAETEVVPRRTKGKITRRVADLMRKRAQDLGWEAGELLSFSLQHPAAAKNQLPKALGAASGLPTAYHVLFKRSEKQQKAAEAADAKVTLIVALIGKEVNGRLVSVSEVHSR